MRLLSAQAPDSCTVKFTAPRRSAVHTHSRGFKKCSARRFSMHKHKNSHGRGATLPKHARGDRSTSLKTRSLFAAPTGTSISLRSYAWCQRARLVGHIFCARLLDAQAPRLTAQPRGSIRADFCPSPARPPSGLAESTSLNT